VATSTYMQNRKKWFRPQGVVFSNNPGTLQNNFYFPTGQEWQDFIILSDHNRQSMSISKERIENRMRMVNGNMRSYHTADKNTIEISWENLPSRAFSEDPAFNSSGKITNLSATSHTADNGAGGSDLLRWYEDHPGPFYVLLSYDKTGSGNMARYTDVMQVFFSSFNYTISTRGKDLFDMWDISINLEEV
jgi:hypothetical protein